MTAATDIGVVIPVYNRAHLVLEALGSVVRQSVPPRRVVVVDDGSTDGTADNVERWRDARSLPFELRVVRQMNRGVSCARNRGLREMADCDKLLFLDSDDLLPPDFFARTAPLLDARPPAAVACADIQVDKYKPRAPGGGREHVGFFSTKALDRAPLAWLFKWHGGICSAALCRRSAVEAVGGFDENLWTGQDADFFARLAIFSSPWRHAPGAPVMQRWNAGGAPRLKETMSEFAAARYWALIYERLSRLPQARRMAPEGGGLLAKSMYARWRHVVELCPDWGNRWRPLAICAKWRARLFAQDMLGRLRGARAAQFGQDL